MRKVMYRYWIPAQKKDPQVNGYQNNTKDGTGCYSDTFSGFFHGWGYESHEDSNSMVMSSVAMVEDITSGQIHKIDPERMRFMQPETREHSSEKKVDSLISPELLQGLDFVKNTLVDIENLIQSIDSKLKSL